MTLGRKGTDRGAGPPGAKVFRGKLFFLWNFHRLKVKANREAKILRGMNHARVIKYTYPSGRSVWAVYARQKIKGGF
jgi:hypothetical protein